MFIDDQAVSFAVDILARLFIHQMIQRIFLYDINIILKYIYIYYILSLIAIELFYFTDKKRSAISFI